MRGYTLDVTGSQPVLPTDMKIPPVFVIIAWNNDRRNALILEASHTEHP
ncbi:MAG TPA: hypothetical protein VFI73_05610 [Candidatus Nitrosopolaris sp.]|nr:hypothetical protein [Candidatus Nitrosopolaris sp.]